ncbi:sugar porter family MFS transporter [Micrococcales bacterium 31B]|nr:sugar porter family MFS transporter [Micrococcales bacterium 31B]
MSHSSIEPHTPLPPLSRGPHSKRLGIISYVATFGGLLFGYDTGVINGALEPLRRELQISATIEGFVVSILIFGAALGAVIGGRLADRYGRRHNILLLAGVFIVGTLLCTLSPTWQVLAVGRFILGLAVGGASATVPVYLAEISPYEKRGSLVTRNEMMIVSGQFAAFVINAVLYHFFSHVDSIWRFMLLVAVLPAIALLVGMVFLPESPRWLISQGRPEAAHAVLLQVRDSARARAEMDEVQHLADEEAAMKTGGWADLAVPWIRRLIIIGALIGVFSQLSGINAVMYYGSELLRNAGFAADAAIVFNTLNGLVSVLGVLISMRLINRLNRRTMLIAGFVLTTTFHLLIALTAMLLPDGDLKMWLILVFVLCFVLSMQGAIGPLAWLMLSEIFPLKIRSFAMGVAVFTLWIANAVVAFAFPPLIAAAGIALTFFVFVAFGLVAIVTLYRMLPETRGKTLEEFEDEARLGFAAPGASNAR